jgi:hypothetical protein
MVNVGIFQLSRTGDSTSLRRLFAYFALEITLTRSMSLIAIFHQVT